MDWVVSCIYYSSLDEDSNISLGVAFNDAYNKTGNILHGSLNSMTVRVMDGHKMMHHPGGIGPDPYYPTVSSVQFSQDGHFMFSGSFGKAVNIWRGDDGELLDSVDVGSEVLHIAVSPAHNRVVAAGCKSGIVALVRINDQGKRSGLSILPPQKTQVEASNIAWCNAAKPNWLVAAYDNALPSSNKGDIIVFDAVAEKVVARPKPASGRQFDVFLDHNSGYFATASSRGRKGAKSQVHIWSLDGRVGGSVGRLHEFDCESEDINKVTIS